MCIILLYDIWELGFDMEQYKKSYMRVMLVLISVVSLGVSTSGISLEDGENIAYSMVSIDESMANSNPPYACFQWYPKTPDVGQTVYFDASCSFDVDGTIVDYYWSYTAVGSSHFPVSMGHGVSITHSWDVEDDYEVSLVVTDDSNVTDDFVRVVSIGNHPPEIPSAPLGSSYGNPGSSYVFSTNTTDVDDDQVKYGWDWNGDYTVDEWSGLVDDGSIDSRSHIWSEIGTYIIRVKARDEHGGESGFSTGSSITISSNSPPNKPSRPVGSSRGRIGQSYSYSSSASDPDGDRIYYLFDWGDDSPTGWIGPYNSGAGITDSHIWHVMGAYPVKVKAKDDPNGDGDLSDGLESFWSDSLPVSMPKKSAAPVSLENLLMEFNLFFRVLDLLFIL
jgi:hypothetical protein